MDLICNASNDNMLTSYVNMLIWDKYGEHRYLYVSVNVVAIGTWYLF